MFSSLPRRIPLCWGVVCAWCLATCTGCHPPQPIPTQAEQPAAALPEITAEVLVIVPQVWPDVVRTQGTLIADEVAVVGAKVAGRVVEVRVDLGDLVDAQAPLVALDTDVLKLEIDQAEALLKQARAAVGLKDEDPVSKLDPINAPPVREQKATWDEAKALSARVQQLAQQNAVTEDQVDQAVAAEKVAEARYSAAVNGVNEKIALIGVRTVELAQARQRLQDATTPAPFTGLVQERHVAPGSYVQVGQPLVSLVRANPLRFRGTVPERYAQRLSPGQEVNLEVQTVPGLRTIQLTRINPVLNDRSRSLEFEAVVENPDGLLRAGLFASGEVILNPEATKMVLPESAVVEFAGAEKVWKVVGGQSEEQVVVTGERRDGKVEILKGLIDGDVVLLHGDTGQLAKVTPVIVDWKLQNED